MLMGTQAHPGEHERCPISLFAHLPPRYAVVQRTPLGSWAHVFGLRPTGYSTKAASGISRPVSAPRRIQRLVLLVWKKETVPAWNAGEERRDQRWLRGISRSALWLRLCAFSAGGMGSIPDRGIRIPQVGKYGQRNKAQNSSSSNKEGWEPDQKSRWRTTAIQQSSQETLPSWQSPLGAKRVPTFWQGEGILLKSRQPAYQPFSSYPNPS